MQLGNRLDASQPHFNWIGLVILLVIINASISSLTSFYWFVLPVSLLSVIVFRRHLEWKIASIALVLTFTIFHPVRLLFDWWLNPIAYGLVTLAGLIVFVLVLKRVGWKNYITALLIVCVLLSGYEMVVSAYEVGQCWVEDIRYTQYFYCGSSVRGYQQIETLPIGMLGWCYYCFWY